MAKFLSIRDAVADNLKHGDSVAFEGFTHLIPHAAAHEVIRQGFKDLTVMRMTPDIIYDQLIGMGMVKKMIFSFAGNPGVGLLRRVRDAVENQWPHALEVEEHSHAAMANAYEAGAAGLPCAVFRGYLGAELAKVNANIKSIICPFTGEQLAAVPALRPDVTFIHAQKADRKGNVLIEGILGVQKEAVLAATPMPAYFRTGRLPPFAWFRAVRIHPMQAAIMTVTMSIILNGTPLLPTVKNFWHGWTNMC